MKVSECHKSNFVLWESKIILITYFPLKTDAFQTPCSTPPGSAASESESEDEVIDETFNSQVSSDQIKEGLNELSLHHKLYDR